MTTNEELVAAVDKLRRDGAASVSEACKQAGISQGTYYTTRKRMLKAGGAAPGPAPLDPTQPHTIGDLERLCALQSAVLEKLGIVLTIRRS